MSTEVVPPVLPELLAAVTGCDAAWRDAPCSCKWPVAAGPSSFPREIARLRFSQFYPIGPEDAPAVVYCPRNSNPSDTVRTIAMMVVRTAIGRFLLSLPHAQMSQLYGRPCVTWSGDENWLWTASTAHSGVLQYPAATYPLAVPCKLEGAAAAVSLTIMRRQLCGKCFTQAGVSPDNVPYDTLQGMLAQLTA